MQRKFLSFVFLLCLSFFGTAHAAKQELFTLDPDHSTVQFKISHLFSKVTGYFTTFEGTVDLDAKKMDKMKILGKIDASSINTNVQKRDEHLRSGDFFDVNNPKKPEYKWIVFESNKFTGVTTSGNETKGKLSGKITIHGITKDITLDVTIHNPMFDPWGFERTSISATGKLNRKDFGLTWNKAVETGGFVVGDEVELLIEGEATRKAPQPPATAPSAIKKSS